MITIKEIREPSENKTIRFFILGCSIVLLTYAQTSTGLMFTELIVHRTCQILIGTDDTSKCNIHGKNDSTANELHFEAETEKYASMIVMAKAMIESLLSTVVSLFLGPWSDKGGRRPVLLGGTIGFTVMLTMLSLMCSWDINPWYLIIPSIPGFITGGTITVVMGAMCYATDSTEEEQRTAVMAWMQTAILSGVVLGLFGGPIISTNCGYTTVFSIGAICSALSTLVIYFAIPESVKSAIKESHLRGLFDVSLLKKLVTSIVVKRDGFHRLVAWLAIFVYTFSSMLQVGDTSIGVLFAKARLDWDAAQYSYAAGIGLLLTVIALSGASLFGTSLGASDTMLATLGLLSGLSCALGKALVLKGWHMYLSTSIGMFSAIVPAVMRSILSKSVPLDDIGTVLSLTGLLETLSPMGGAPLFALIFSHYLPPIYPSPVYLVSAALFVLLLLCTACIEVLTRRSRNLQFYTATPEKETEE
ncbi:tetracycline resistance protein, class D-like isoform X1 [Neodiprion fabricii]|uniref:tetracycline resistance protein, class D-like isoform X1 n=2 Tax=Neodiprion fabricii TaxID=2872261 RepID=UPI001ED8FB4F|nr:tetracycline resistance protein, class D-like isoform X1 [Neodiprion fabricii]